MLKIGRTLANSFSALYFARMYGNLKFGIRNQKTLLRSEARFFLPSTLLITLAAVFFSSLKTSAQDIPRYFDAVHKADSLHAASQNASAIHYYRKALKFHSKDPQTWLDAAKTSLELGKLNEAANLIKNAIGNGPTLR